MSHYYLIVKEITTNKVVFEDGFINRHEMIEEVKKYPPEDFCYAIETIKVPDFA
jgi:hypothetical protein